MYYFGSYWVFFAGQAFLWLQQAGAPLRLRGAGFSLPRLLLLQSTGSGAQLLPQSRLLGSRMGAQWLQPAGLAALRPSTLVSIRRALVSLFHNWEN